MRLMWEVLIIVFFLSAECPVCGDMIAHRKINSHLDACLTRTEKKSSLRRYKQNIKSNSTILLTELEGCTGEYQPNFLDQVLQGLYKID